MKVAVTGASGLIGGALVDRMAARGDQVTVLTRDPDGARARHDAKAPPAGGESATHERQPRTFARWEPLREPAPAQALREQDAIVHLAGEPIAQRWSEKVKRAIRDSRVLGTRNLVQGLRTLDEGARPRALVSASAIGYYGSHGPEPIDEDAPAGSDFLAQVCADWEAEARGAEQLGMRAAQVRIGVVLERSGGALAQMLRPFRLGLGGPVGGGAQYMAWIHCDDLVGMMLAALSDERWSGPFNGTAPEPVTSGVFARALGHALHRPALLPVPTLALRLLYGEMAYVITTGVRAMPAKALVLGYSFEHPRLEEALRSALG
ncbi:MAG TPA: TIGR01777 family oxidoreductase [Solirubrobacteraceae bacterium]|nr:TIGR01777 family oxidoreductase [Solirubrobacteraceae bacterium]